MTPRELHNRLARLERAHPRGDGDPAAIRLFLGLGMPEEYSPRERRAALEALEPSGLRDHLLGCLDQDGNVLPHPDSAEWVPPGELAYSVDERGYRIISVVPRTDR